MLVPLPMCTGTEIEEEVMVFVYLWKKFGMPLCYAMLRCRGYLRADASSNWFINAADSLFLMCSTCF
jgi:hypothetical protein